MDGEVVLPQPPEGLLDGQGVLRRGVGVPPPLEDMDGQVQTGQGLPVGGNLRWPRNQLVVRGLGSVPKATRRPPPRWRKISARLPAYAASRSAGVIRPSPSGPARRRSPQGLPHRSRPRPKLLPGDAPISVGVKILAEHGVQPQPRCCQSGPPPWSRWRSPPATVRPGVPLPCSHSRAIMVPSLHPSSRSSAPAQRGWA